MNALIYQAWALLSAIYAYLIDTGNEFDAGHIRLFTNVIDWSVPHVTGDFTAPTFTGYAPVTATFAEVASADGSPRLSAGVKTFHPTNDTDLPQVIRGAYFVNAAGDFMYGGNFPAPITVSASLQPIYVLLDYDLNDSQPCQVDGWVA